MKPLRDVKRAWAARRMQRTRVWARAVVQRLLQTNYFHPDNHEILLSSLAADDAIYAVDGVIYVDTSKSVVLSIDRGTIAQVLASTDGVLTWLSLAALSQSVASRAFIAFTSLCSCSTRSSVVLPLLWHLEYMRREMGAAGRSGKSIAVQEWNHVIRAVVSLLHDTSIRALRRCRVFLAVLLGVLIALAGVLAFLKSIIGLLR